MQAIKYLGHLQLQKEKRSEESTYVLSYVVKQHNSRCMKQLFNWDFSVDYNMFVEIEKTHT